MSDTIDRLTWRNARVGDQVGKYQIAKITPVGLAVRSLDLKFPDGLLLPLASSRGEGRLDGVVRAQLCPECKTLSSSGRAHPACANVQPELTAAEVAAMAGCELVEDWDAQDAKFGPWPASMQGLEIVVFDYETTGFKPDEGARPVELAAVRVSEEGILGTWSSLINPEIPIPAESTAIHGITDQMVRDAPLEDVVLEGFLDFAEGVGVIAGHNVPFDAGFLKFGLLRYDFEIPKFKMLDTLKMARDRFPRGRKAGSVANHKLGTLTSHLGIEHGTAHRALDDTIATAKLLNYLLVQIALEEQSDSEPEAA